MYTDVHYTANQFRLAITLVKGVETPACIKTGRDIDMAKRNLPENYVETTYVEGYLHTLAITGAGLKYGYSLNHLPETTGKAREIKSSYELANK